MLKSLLGTPCNHDSFGRYCSKCGHERLPPRLTFKSLIEEFIASWLQKGFRQTVFGLFIAPGQQLRRYIKADRTLLVKPVSYLILIVAFNYWILSLTKGGAESLTAVGLASESTSGSDPVMTEALVWLMQHNFEFSLFQAFMLAGLLRFVFYRKRHLSMAELTIFSTYVLAQSLLLKGLLNVVLIPTNTAAPGWVVMLMGIVYNTWAIASFMDGISVGGVLRALSSIFTSIVASFIAVIVVLIIWDLNHQEIKEAVEVITAPVTQGSSFGPR